MEGTAKLENSEKSSSNFQDYLTDGHRAPVLDSQDDCQMDEAMESGGTTTIKYHRKVDTGDSKDVVIEVNSVDVLTFGYSHIDSYSTSFPSGG